MPKKLKEIRKILKEAGFSCKQAKGSHEKWSHPLLKRPIVIAGKDSKDAKAYLERQVERSLEEINWEEKS